MSREESAPSSPLKRAPDQGCLGCGCFHATLGFSEFVPTIYFGVLVSLSMFGGLIGNLLVLPLLLRMIVRE